MLYLLAILLPPVAVLACGKPGQAILNLILTLFLWFPGALHALLVVNSYYADQRNERLIAAMRGASPERARYIDASVQAVKTAESERSSSAVNTVVVTAAILFLLCMALYAVGSITGAAR